MRADRVVVTAGAWNPQLVPQLAGLLHVDRVPLFWFEPARDHAELARLPAHIVDGEVTRGCYGFPYLPDQGLKVATLGTSVPCDPTPSIEDLHVHDEPDEHFIIGMDAATVYASACSGHGFKLSSVMGEILADLATTGPHRS
jgi:sarcosine oxidase